MAKLDDAEPHNMKGLPKVDGPRASPFLAESAACICRGLRFDSN
ncbi:hypothetical protein [Paenibacillus lautus]|nr:hypothetical protein [Paenibacillus lautus]